VISVSSRRLSTISPEIACEALTTLPTSSPLIAVRPEPAPVLM